MAHGTIYFNLPQIRVGILCVVSKRNSLLYTGYEHISMDFEN